MKLIRTTIHLLIVTVIIGLWALCPIAYAQPHQLLLAQLTPALVAVQIHDIQGSDHRSPLVDETVTDVPGIVTVSLNKGFFMQDPESDDDNATSEAIFVFTKTKPTVDLGDEVLVSGVVKEFVPNGAATKELSDTQIDASDDVANITVLSSGNDLPEPIVIGQGGRILPEKVIDNDQLTRFDPDSDGIDFYESLEGMLVQINDAIVVSPTNDFGEIIVLADDGKDASVLSERGGIVIQADDFNPERIMIDDTVISREPKVNVGDRFTAPVVGIIDYGFSNFKLLNTKPLPTVTAGNLPRETTPLTSTANQLTIASFNVENLDPGDGNRIDVIADRIVNALKSPDILGLIEIQDNNGAKDDSVVEADLTYSQLIAAIQNAGGTAYEAVDIAPADDQDGGEPGGNIRPGFLYRPDRVSLVDRPKGKSTEAVTLISDDRRVDLSVNPGRIDPTNSAFQRSRKPLVTEFLFNGQKIFVIANHFNSKREDDALFGKVQPPQLKSEAQRIQQAEIVNKFVNQILTADADANVVVLGDINDFEFSKPVQVLEGDILVDLVAQVPLNDRYTFNFQGNSQVLDHILVSQHLATTADPAFDIVHINADFVDKASDHDPLIARLDINPTTASIPVTEPDTETPDTETSDTETSDTEIIFSGQSGQSLINQLADTYAPTSTLSYGEARDLLYSTIDNVDGVVTGIYTGYQITLNPTANPRIDALAKGVNAEHVWPQSRGAQGGAKSDLHNLFPARVRVNSARSNSPFQEIADRTTIKWFRNQDESSSIPTRSIDDYSELASNEFEPRENKAGDVARTMFYFRTIHSDRVKDPGFFEQQQETLCQWHQQDPVETAEIARSHAIAESPQGNENPFVLDSTLAERTYCTPES
ncbi:MAG: hypothetical protein HC865_07380 [Cyanobacteria bacterium RU_5_0]|nr:hypothetical protein [Cyanobacteria bacterium RU_5_0]